MCPSPRQTNERHQRLEDSVFSPHASLNSSKRLPAQTTPEKWQKQRENEEKKMNARKNTNNGNQGEKSGAKMRPSLISYSPHTKDGPFLPTRPP